MGWSAIENPCFSAGGTGLSHGWRTKIRVYVCVCSVVSNCFVTAWTIAHQAPCPWDAPGMNTGVGCHARLQGIFPTQGSKLHLLHWQADSLSVCLFVCFTTEPPEKSRSLWCSQKLLKKNKWAKGHNVYREEAYCGLNSVPCKILTLKL